MISFNFYESLSHSALRMVNRTTVIIIDALVVIYLCYINHSSFCNEQELFLQQQFCGNIFVFEFILRKYAEFIFVSRIKS